MDLRLLGHNKLRLNLMRFRCDISNLIDRHIAILEGCRFNILLLQSSCWDLNLIAPFVDRVHQPLLCLWKPSERLWNIPSNFALFIHLSKELGWLCFNLINWVLKVPRSMFLLSSQWLLLKAKIPRPQAIRKRFDRRCTVKLLLRLVQVRVRVEDILHARDLFFRRTTEHQLDLLAASISAPICLA